MADIVRNRVGCLINILSGDGLYLSKRAGELLTEKKEMMDQLSRENKPASALEFFFNELEYIILHKKFTSSDLNKYKKVFKKAEEFTLPGWIEFSGGSGAGGGGGAAG